MANVFRLAVTLMVLATTGLFAVGQDRQKPVNPADHRWIAGGLVDNSATGEPDPLETYLLDAQTRTGVLRPTPGVLDAIAAGLGSDKPSTRRAAMGAMGAVVSALSHIDAVPADIQLVHSHNGVQRALLDATRAPEAAARATAASHLGSVAVPHGSALNDVWVRLVETDPAPPVREMAAYQLGRFGGDDARAAAAVTAALRDPESRVRKQAALSVAKLLPAGAVPVLVDGLRSASEEARFEFAHALIAYGEQARQYLPLLRTAAEGESRRPERDALERALQTLGQ